MEPPKVEPAWKRWVRVLDRLAVFLGMAVGFTGVGVMWGLSELNDRLAREDARHVAELARMQESHGQLVGSLTRQLQALARQQNQTATAVAKTVEKVDNAAEKADTAANTAKGAAAVARSAATRNTAVPPATVNKSIREANRQLGAKP